MEGPQETLLETNGDPTGEGQEEGQEVVARRGATESCQDQTLEFGEIFYSTITGLFDDKPADNVTNSLAFPSNDGTKHLTTQQSTVTKPLSIPKPKRHERNVSWGVLPSPTRISTHVPRPSGLPVHTRSESRMFDISTAGSVPSVIAIDQLSPNQHNNDINPPNSFMSLPTLPKPPLPPKAKVSHHKRTFSTAQNVGNNRVPPSPQPPYNHNRSLTQTQMPSYSMDFLFAQDDVSRFTTDNNEPPQERSLRSFTNTCGNTTNKQHSNPKSTTENIGTRKRINLNDVVMTAPLELEAETHILRALEEQQAEDSGRNNNNTKNNNPSFQEQQQVLAGNILPHVPDDTVHGFSSSPPPSVTAGKEESEANSTNNRGNIKGANDHGGVAITEQGIECMESPSTKQEQSNPSQSDNITTKETKPLLGKKAKSHRHTKSVEQTLFGLTAVLSAMDDAHQKNNQYCIDDNDDDGDDDIDASSKAGDSDTVSGIPATDKVAKTAHDLASRLKRQQSMKYWNVETDTELVPERLSEPDRSGSVRSNDGLVDQGDEEEGRSVSAPTTISISKTEGDSTTSDETEEANAKTTVDEERKKTPKKHRRNVISRASAKLKDDWDIFSEVLSPKRASMFLRNILLLLIFPAMGIAAVLFYSLENPNTGYNGGQDENAEKASVSWWLLFLVRQAITFTLALATQAIIIDFLAVGSWIFLRFFGPILTLFLAQSKGWPFILLFWGVYNSALLSGPSRLANHWGYFQDLVGLFNETNPSGNVTDNDLYLQIIYIAIGVGIAVSIKRLVVGLFLGRQSFANYGQELASVMNKMVLVSEIAGLALEIYRFRDEFVPKSMKKAAQWDLGWKSERFHTMMTSFDSDKEEPKVDQQATCRDRAEQQPEKNGRLMDLLERWEEPDRARQELKNGISISAVLQFRRAISCMQRKYPFSIAFGSCDTRETCIESAQNVYERLMLRSPERDLLNFETIALIAKGTDGVMDERKVKDLIKVFRPDRNGDLSKLEFVKSVDNVYKALRLLTATVANSGQIDQAFGNIVNMLFYTVLGCIVLWYLGFDPLALFLSMSSVILAFAFVFSSASAKYFEGMIFILVQRPFGVGDRIHISDVNSQTDPNGSTGWVVEKVSLFSTTMFWTATNEYATISNAAIANSRIINAARSPHAKLQVKMMFGIDVPYERIVIFKSAVEQYLKARPREWLQLVGFRASNVTVDRGFIEYNIIALHRESWQSVASVLESRATLTSYCLEVAKQLEMRYMSPPLPVSLRVAEKKLHQEVDMHTVSNNRGFDDKTDFRSMALSHGIKLDP